MGEEIFRCLFDLDIARQRGDDRFVDAFGPQFLDDLCEQLREDHRRRDDGVPVAEDE